MDDKKRGDDAQDHAPRSVAETVGVPPADPKDGEQRGTAEAVDIQDLGSDNDGGAG